MLAPPPQTVGFLLLGSRGDESGEGCNSSVEVTEVVNAPEGPASEDARAVKRLEETLVLIPRPMGTLEKVMC